MALHGHSSGCIRRRHFQRDDCWYYFDDNCRDYDDGDNGFSLLHACRNLGRYVLQRYWSRFKFKYFRVFQRHLPSAIQVSNCIFHYLALIKADVDVMFAGSCIQSTKQNTLQKIAL